MLLKDLDGLDKKEVERRLDEEKVFRQKVRESWLKEEDKNVAFFHQLACMHHSFKHLKKIIMDGC